MSTGSHLFDLERNAPQLRLQREWKDEDGKAAGQVWEISFPGCSHSEVYLDASTGDAVRRVGSWVDVRFRNAHQKRRISALPTLVVSGLVKTGKSYTLNKVVPAMLAEELAKVPANHPLKGIKVLRLDCMNLKRRSGAGALMYDLLSVLMEWAAEADVQIDDVLKKKVQSILNDGPNSMSVDTHAGRAVVNLFEGGFQTPVLVLIDELQALLQPTTIDAGLQEQLNRGDIAFIRDVVVRGILVGASPHVLVAVTGSSMAMVWMSLAAMPVYGTAPLNQIKTVHLPASVPPYLMEELVVHSLRQLGVSQPPMQQAVGQLLERSGDSPALFMTMLELWSMEKMMDIVTFVDDFMKNKLFEEGMKEWTLALAHMSDEDRCRVLDLANVVLGAQIVDFPDRGIWRFLEPYMRKTEHGRYYLADPLQRLLLRAVIGRGGKLCTSFTGLGEGLTLVQLDFGWLLLQLGEVADYLVGQRRPPKGFSSHIEGASELTGMLKDFTTKMKLPGAEGMSTAERWGALPAFQKALKSPYNKGSRAWYKLEGKDKKLQSDLDYLVFFLRLCRNVLAHHWQQQGLLDILQVMVMALPEMLGMSSQALAEQVRTCMSKLEPATIKAAAAAADADDKGEQERSSAGSPGGPRSDPSTGSGGSAPGTRSAGSASGSNASDASASSPSGVAGASSGSAASAGNASGFHPSASTFNASVSAPSTVAGVSTGARSFGAATSTGSAPSTRGPSACSTASALSRPHASASSPSAPSTGASGPSASAGGIGVWGPLSSCSKASTALSRSSVPAAARRCLLAGKAVVPHMQAMLPTPVVRRLNLMRVTTTARTAFRFG